MFKHFYKFPIRHHSLFITGFQKPLLFFKARSLFGRIIKFRITVADQRARFKEQQRLLESGDEEAMMPDWEFVEMLEHGMPPTCGFGFGERLFAFMIDSTVREASLFPLMKPKISINY